MRLSKFSERFDEDVRQLARALSRLEEGQGRQARFNARADVRRVLERVRTRMDAAFPVIPKEGGRASSSRGGTAEQKVARQALKLKRAGWVAMPGNVPLLAALASVGIRVKQLSDGRVFGPAWSVVAAGPRLPYDVKKLRECKRSVTARRALLGANALSSVPIGGAP